MDSNLITNPEAYGMYLGHSCFLLEFKELIMLFDWAQDELPSIRSDKTLIVFISHTHSDHFNRKVFDLVKTNPDVIFILGYDYSSDNFNNYIDNLPKDINERLAVIDGGKAVRFHTINLKVTAINSTDIGVAFIIEYAGRTLFHAGDLFLMQTKSKKDYMDWYNEAIRKNPSAHIWTYDEWKKECMSQFVSYTEPLKGRTFDYGMIPLDPRFDDIAVETVKRYFEIADFKSWSPMHLWGDYDFVDRFLKFNPGYAKNMIAITRRLDVKMQIKLGEYYPIF